MVRLLGKGCKVKLGGFRFQFQASYVSSQTEELWYNETVCLWMTIYIYIYIYIYLRIIFLFYLLRTFCPHLGSFCVVSSFTTFRPNFTSGLLQGILPRPRIGMLSLVTVSPVITAFHHLKKARGEIWSKRSERRNNTKTTKMRTKSPQ